MQLPTEDKYTYKKSYVENQIAILMGGRVAEELTQGEITTGAGNDIERSTDLARRMVCEWGMSELGPLSYGDKDEPVFLGRECPAGGPGAGPPGRSRCRSSSLSCSSARPGRVELDAR
jgi:ATP-dependent Zn protease